MDINILGLWAHTSTACSASAMDESWTRLTQWYPETWRQLTTEAYCMILRTCMTWGPAQIVNVVSWVTLLHTQLL